MLTKKDYKAFAAVLARGFKFARDLTVGQQAAIAALHHVASDLADVLKADNPRFDRERFIAAYHDGQSGSSVSVSEPRQCGFDCRIAVDGLIRSKSH